MKKKQYAEITSWNVYFQLWKHISFQLLARRILAFPSPPWQNNYSVQAEVDKGHFRTCQGAWNLLYSGFPLCQFQSLFFFFNVKPSNLAVLFCALHESWFFLFAFVREKRRRTSIGRKGSWTKKQNHCSLHLTKTPVNWSEYTVVGW